MYRSAYAYCLDRFSYTPPENVKHHCIGQRIPILNPVVLLVTYSSDTQNFVPSTRHCAASLSNKISIKDIGDTSLLQEEVKAGCISWSEIFTVTAANNIELLNEQARNTFTAAPMVVKQ